MDWVFLKSRAHTPHTVSCILFSVSVLKHCRFAGHQQDQQSHDNSHSQGGRCGHREAEASFRNGLVHVALLADQDKTETESACRKDLKTSLFLSVHAPVPALSLFLLAMLPSSVTASPGHASLLCLHSRWPCFFALSPLLLVPNSALCLFLLATLACSASAPAGHAGLL